MVQVVRQTKEQQIAMYMKLSKKELAEMLYNCNLILSPSFLETPQEPGIYVSGSESEGYEVTHVYAGQMRTAK